MFIVFAFPKKAPRTGQADFRIAPILNWFSGEPHPIWESAGKLAMGMALGRDDLLD